MVFGKYRKTIAHSENCLPELDIQAVFRNVAWFCKRVGSISRDYIFNFSFVSLCTREDPRTDKPMDFTPEVEIEVIREAVSQKLDRPLVHPSNKFGRDSNQIKIQIHLFILVTL